MSTFYVCDWCGEPVEKPIKLSATGGEKFIFRPDVGHYHHAEDRSCWNEAMDALGAVEEANKFRDTPA